MVTSAAGKTLVAPIQKYVPPSGFPDPGNGGLGMKGLLYTAPAVVCHPGSVGPVAENCSDIAGVNPERNTSAESPQSINESTKAIGAKVH